MANSKLKLILASASPRRKELLGHLKIPFEIIALSIPEESAAVDPLVFSQEIAAQKSEAVARKLVQERSGENFFIVAADTVVYLDGKIYGKPSDVQDAKRILLELSGKTHSVFTAVSLRMIVDGKVSHHFFAEETKVTFDAISSDLLERYLATGDSLDKAGAYGIQGASLSFISNVTGDYANVVGFPLSRFVNEARDFLNKTHSTEASWFTHFQS